MAFKVVWTEPALDDLESIRRYIAEDNPAAADRVVETIFAVGDRIEGVPRLGPRYECRKPGEIRHTISGKYRIFYEVREAEEKVRILTVRHGARQEPELLTMRIALGCDHGGFPLKQRIVSVVQAAGHEVVDCGTDSNCAVDYPDFARKVGETILAGRAERGILICGSGVGISVAANKIPGIRAGVCHDIYSAHQGVGHDDMNVLCLGARIVGDEVAVELVRAFVSAQFTNEVRHVRRLNKLLDIERDALAGKFTA